MKIVALFIIIFPLVTLANESKCYGTTSNGRLENGVKLPDKGKNFVGYSKLARIAGRTYVHSEVKKIILKSYATLEIEHPDKVFKYAETGFKKGGEFKPHKTHRNGLSVDFMTPVITPDGNSVHLPTHPLNKLGYNIEFDEAGNFEGLRIDYEALSAHLVSLHKAAKALGHDIWRVIFDPKLQPYLLNTQYGQYIKDNIQLSKKRSWVRHDEHYHVDFSVQCE